MFFVMYLHAWWRPKKERTETRSAAKKSNKTLLRSMVIHNDTGIRNKCLYEHELLLLADEHRMTCDISAARYVPACRSVPDPTGYGERA